MPQERSRIQPPRYAQTESRERRRCENYGNASELEVGCTHRGPGEHAINKNVRESITDAEAIDEIVRESVTIRSARVLGAAGPSEQEPGKGHAI